MARVNEKAVQAAVVRLYRAVGCQPFGLSQPRATMQAAGLPDLWVFCPRKRAAWWHEVKARDGRASAEQVAFAELCAQCGVARIIGGTEEAKAHLRSLGLISEPGRA